MGSFLTLSEISFRENPIKQVNLEVIVLLKNDKRSFSNIYCRAVTKSESVVHNCSTISVNDTITF